MPIFLYLRGRHVLQWEHNDCAFCFFRNWRQERDRWPQSTGMQRERRLFDRHSPLNSCPQTRRMDPRGNYANGWHGGARGWSWRRPPWMNTTWQCLPTVESGTPWPNTKDLVHFQPVKSPRTRHCGPLTIQSYKKIVKKQTNDKWIFESKIKSLVLLICWCYFQYQYTDTLQFHGPCEMNEWNVGLNPS